MKKSILILAIASLFSVGANAACTKVGNMTSCYDSTSGNTITTHKFGNQSFTNGRNSKTGTTWNSSTNRIGNSSFTNGRSSTGATWSSSTNNGVSSYSGRTRTGKTYTKTCTTLGCY